MTSIWTNRNLYYYNADTLVRGKELNSIDSFFFVTLVTNGSTAIWPFNNFLP